LSLVGSEKNATDQQHGERLPVKSVNRVSLVIDSGRAV